MKKFLVVMLCCGLIFGVLGCASEDKPPPDDPATDTVPDDAEKEVDDAADEADDAVDEATE